MSDQEKDFENENDLMNSSNIGEDEEYRDEYTEELEESEREALEAETDEKEDPDFTEEDDEGDEYDELDGNDKRKEQLKFGLIAAGVIAAIGTGAYFKFLNEEAPVQSPQPQRVNFNNASTSTQTAGSVNEEAASHSGGSVQQPQQEQQPQGDETLESLISGMNSTNASLEDETPASAYNAADSRAQTDKSAGVSNQAVNDLNEQIEQLRNRLSSQQQTINALEQKVNRQQSSTPQQRLSDLEHRVENIESFINKQQQSFEMIESLIERERQERLEREGNVRLSVPAFAEGRERMIGYQFLTTAKDPNLVIVRDPEGSMTVLAKGSAVKYQGQKIKVRDISEDGSVILVGKHFFIDSTEGVGPKNGQYQPPRENKEPQAKQATDTKTEKVAEPIVRDEDKPSISGWKVSAIIGDQVMVSLPDGRFITLVEGEGVKRYGKVQRIAADGTVYFKNHKIELSH